MTSQGVSRAFDYAGLFGTVVGKAGTSGRLSKPEQCSKLTVSVHSKCILRIDADSCTVFHPSEENKSGLGRRTDGNILAPLRLLFVCLYCTTQRRQSFCGNVVESIVARKGKFDFVVFVDDMIPGIVAEEKAMVISISGGCHSNRAVLLRLYRGRDSNSRSVLKRSV